MPRDSSGNYTLPAGNPVVSGTTIEASWANPTLEDIALALTGSLPRNGSAPMGANLGMGGFKITGMGDGTAATDGATVGNITAALNTWIPSLTLTAPEITDEIPLARGAATLSATVQDILSLAGAATVPDASETVKGIAELATDGEVFGGIDTTRIVTPASLRNYGLGVYKAVQVAATKVVDFNDVGQYIYNAGASALTITTPASSDTSIPFGSRIDFFQNGTGTMTFVPGAGVTIVGAATVLRQFKAATLVRISATVWHLIGGVSV